MKIEFNYVKFKNFLSYGNYFTEIRLDEHPTTVLTGDSGSGKSAVLDAVCFGLFGRPFRNISKGQLVNMMNNKSCVVENGFKIGNAEYKVVRGIKPAIMEVYKNGTLLPQESNVNDYQKILENQILRTNYKSFVQVVILGAAGTIPFMQLKAADRRSIIENLLDIEVFSAMLTLLKVEVNSIKCDMDSQNSDRSSKKDKIDIHKRHLNDLMTIKEENKDKLDKELAELAEKRSIIEEKIEKVKKAKEEFKENKSDDVKTRREKLEQLSNELDKIRNLKATVNAQMGQSKKHIDFFGGHDVCPTCGQNIDKDFKEGILSKELATVEKCKKGIESADDKINRIRVETDESNKIIDEYREKERELDSILRKFENEVSQVESAVRSLKRSYEGNKLDENAIAETREEIKSLQTGIDEITKKLNGLGEDLQVHKVAVEILKDSGIKAKIVKQYIPVMNTCINKYLHEMQFFIKFSMDENFDETISSKGSDTMSYYGLSEGEKQRLDLSILFTWRQIAKIKSSINTNLLALDELMDSYLDSDAAENVLSLLTRNDFAGMNIFVVSHKADIVDKFDHVLKFKKVKGFSINDQTVA